MYFNPTVHSPMLRSCAEAMLAGSSPVVLNTHDADMLIKQGANSYCGNSTEELTEYMLWILQHETERRRMSREARLAAMGHIQYRQEVGGVDGVNFFVVLDQPMTLCMEKYS